MLSVGEALAQIVAGADRVLSAENIGLSLCVGRTLARDVAALRTQPPFAASAMDGYALRAQDLAATPREIEVIGTSAAGRGFAGKIDAGQAVRIFTGAPVPEGADAVLIQENTRIENGRVIALQGAPAGHNIRPPGLDFLAGQALLRAGQRLGPAAVALAAAMNHVELPVVRKPRVAILATGDELVAPGSPIGPAQIVASNGFAVAAYVEQAGGEAIDLGIAGDTFESLQAGLRRARAAESDVLVTIGGASVGDHDLVQSALTREGLKLGFWKIAMRPGKPLMHGGLSAMRVLGLPGNPVSAIVCAIVFLRPLIRALSGDPQAARDPCQTAVLGADVKANDGRQDYLRASLETREGASVATALSPQDSSMLRILAQAGCLIVRAPFAPAARAGDPCRIVRL